MKICPETAWDVCIVFFIWVLLEGGIIIFQIKFFIDSVKVHS